MDAQTMLRTAVVLLAITAAGGLSMAAMRFAGHPRPPSWIAMLHGLLAASGLTLVVYAGLASDMPAGGWGGLLLLLLAVLGGLVLNLRYHSEGLALPVGLMLGHAGVAVAGFLVLALSVWNLQA
ncbi:hypothetical protein [Ramlibacter sp.]|uniref:hypothetical protein n=1 Tax=Ramlibacter sp. TaxID=1917967 RepID=UPI0026075FA4|nr:hypothetical protein [Ramlibacter sp.]MDB5955530.1 hypothetical protein [Ramlibacter sp.]